MDSKERLNRLHEFITIYGSKGSYWKKYKLSLIFIFDRAFLVRSYVDVGGDISSIIIIIE